MIRREESEADKKMLDIIKEEYGTKGQDKN